jgi:hypothetical protein
MVRLKYLRRKQTIFLLLCVCGTWGHPALTQVTQPVTTIVGSSVSSGLDLQQNALLVEIANNSAQPVLNKLVILTTVLGASQATLASTGSTTGVIGICLLNCTTTGNAVIAIAGVAGCLFDNTATAGHYVVASTGSGGECSDTGSTNPPTSGVQVIGRVLVSGSSGTINILVYPTETFGDTGETAAGGTVFGNNTNSTAAPAFTTSPVLGIPGTSAGMLGFAGLTSGTTTVQANSTAGGTTTLNAGTGTGQVTLSAKLGSSDTVNCPNNSETDFSTTYTLPASFLITNRVVRVTWLGRMTTSGSPPSVGFSLKLGSTSVYTATNGGPGMSLSNVPLGITFYIQGTAAAGSSVNVFTNPVGPPTALSSPFSRSSVNQPVTLATNGTLTITPGWACSVNTVGNSATTDQLIVEAIN